MRTQRATATLAALAALAAPATHADTLGEVADMHSDKHLPQEDTVSEI